MSFGMLLLRGGPFPCPIRALFSSRLPFCGSLAVALSRTVPGRHSMAARGTGHKGRTQTH